MAVERECWSAGDLDIDAGRQRVERSGLEIPLPPLSFRLLLELVRAAPNVLSIDDLMNSVWPGLVVGADTVTQRVKLLRESLGDNAQESRYIKGLRGRGYSCAVPVARRSMDRAPLSRRWLAPVLIGVIAVAAIVAWFLPSVQHRSTGLVPERIAVLPFANPTGVAGDAYLGDAIAEELIGRLARSPHLRVIAPTSVRTFRDRPAPVADIGRRLNVTYVLQGNIQREGSLLRVRAELARTADASVAWARTFVRTPAELFAIEDEISRAILERFHAADAIREDPQGSAISSEAHTLFLRANFLTQRSSREGLEEALALYRQALAQAPLYAAAWEGIARVHEFQGRLGFRDRRAAHSLAREAAARALAIDPDFALAHTRLGSVSLREGDLPTAARHIGRGYVLEPRNQLTLGNAVHLMLGLGRIEPALALNHIADELDPLNPRGNFSSGITRLIAGDSRGAIDRFRAALQLSPGFVGAQYGMGIAQLLAGSPDAALASAQLEPSEAYRLRGEAVAAHALGLTKLSDTRLQALIALHAQGRVGAYGIACVYAYRGQADDAFAWLEREPWTGAGDPDDWQVLVEPLLRGLHHDPRWFRLMASIGRSPQVLDAIRIDVP